MIQFKKVQREGARLVIGLAGVSGSGKTYTALQLAYGLAKNDADKIFFVDSENRRGSLYADTLPSPFNIGDLTAPFSPARYIEAIKAASSAGAEVLIIDSISHAWEGMGGAQDIANSSNSRMANWKLAKAEWKKMMDAILQSPCHVILCIRAREKTDFTNPREPKQLGLQPIIEQNAPFEMTASFMMHDMGRNQDILKLPSELSSIFSGSGYIGQDHGLKLRAWVDGAKQLNPDVEHHRGLVNMSTEGGMESLKAQWSQTPADIQKVLGKAFLDSAKASAKAFDDQRAFGTANEDESIASLNALAGQQVNNQFAGKPQPEQQPQPQPEKVDDDEPMF